MKHLALSAATLALLSAPVLAQDETRVIGVSIPAATHGWAGGMNFHAQEAIERLEEVYPTLDFVLSTASDPATQVNDIEDMVATRGIDALVVLPFESEQDAIRIANDTVYGLTNYIQTQDLERGHRVARRMRTGMVELNHKGLGSGSPFGGVRQSGNGREGGTFGLEEFLEIKAVSDWAEV